MLRCDTDLSVAQCIAGGDDGSSAASRGVGAGLPTEAHYSWTSSGDQDRDDALVVRRNDMEPVVYLLGAAQIYSRVV